MGGTALLRKSPTLVRYGVAALGLVGGLVMKLKPEGTFRTTEKSGSVLLKAGLERGGVYGEFPRAVYFDGGLVGESSIESRDEEKQAELWKGSVEIVGLVEGDSALKDWK